MRSLSFTLLQELKNAEARRNMTIEERVSLLETQVSDIQEDVTGLEQESADQETRIVVAEENIEGEFFIRHH